MKSIQWTCSLIATSVLVIAFSGPASAQATRTWVSGVGDDANPCSRTAPCKTFAGAISKTAASGEINCLDPGGFGAVTITQAITIDCGGTFGSTLVSGTNGIVINANTSTDVITLRNLRINGLGTGLSGVAYFGAKAVHLENVDIFGFTVAGVDVATSAAAKLTADNVTVTDNAAGFAISTTAGTAVADLYHVKVSNSTGDGIRTGANASVLVRDSNISLNGVGLNQTGASFANLFLCQIDRNGVGLQSGAGAQAGAFGNVFSQNGTALSSNGGVIFTDGLNTVAGNGANGVANGGTVPKM